MKRTGFAHQKSKSQKVRRLFCCVLAFCCLVPLLASCNCETKEQEDKKSTDNELYTAGLKLISTINDMIQSDAYAEILGVKDFNEAREAVNTNDYDSPVSVYRISSPKPSHLINSNSSLDSNLMEELPENLKEQIEKRFTIATVISVINTQMAGTEKVALSSAYCASDTSDEICIEDTEVFLYTFKRGTPIIITFSKYGSLQGQFVFLENFDTLSEVKDVFEKFGCTVKRVEIN